MEKNYFVQMRFDDGDVAPGFHTAGWILDTMDMSDCSGIELKVWESGEFGELIPLKLRGKWCNEHPLQMKAVRPDGSVAFEGFGTDH